MSSNNDYNLTGFSATITLIRGMNNYIYILYNTVFCFNYHKQLG